MVTEIAPQKHSYDEAFKTLQQNKAHVRLSWLARLRENAMARFDELSFPTTKDEEWKYTNVAAIVLIFISTVGYGRQ